jgi:hypothetical protein
MKAVYRYVGFVFLAGALAAPAAMVTSATPQDEEHHNKDKRRVYDQEHKDYHNWDTNEDHVYRQYLGDQKMDYRDYDKLNRDQQNAYWNWRHSHNDDHQDKH